jgi:hypothetical protein
MMFVALFVGRTRRQETLRIAGGIFFILGLGAFHTYAPWALLHKLPVFASQHAPSRFLYVGVLLLMLAFAALSDRALGRAIARLPILDRALLLPVYFIAANLVEVGRLSTDRVFYLHFPETVQRSDAFLQTPAPKQNYSPSDAWAGPVVLAMMANEGFVTCYSVPERGEPRGAIAKGDPGYAGEAYLASGSGHAKVVNFTTNSAVVEFDDATPGAMLVYNMNFDPSWRVDGRAAVEYRHAVATPISGTSGRVTFRYRPRTLFTSMVLFGLTVLLAFGTPLLVARLRRARKHGGRGPSHPSLWAPRAPEHPNSA